ncbi:MAG: alkaline phosphatase family protein [Thermogemmatispora sp.]|uniref:alkaline phosphatase family protein n=1 Tax=Thermogemmatispora sp. TaxID=1968838 RepID=UPI001A0E082C|nr:alkaline phosphatase family protein [Thermogemmatispora sp.]MBE3564705.1 alkaline phosphatase family protein [Thermogemmatispora sp.]
MRVLLIGVDGLTLRIVKPLMAQGLLPHLRQIYEGGVHALLRAPLPPAATTRWQAILTGLPPQRQGLTPGDGEYDRCLLETVTEPQSASGTLHELGQEDKALWSLLSAWGRRVLVANVPATYPPRPLNGIMLSGPPAPPFYAGLAYPPDFASRLLEVIPNYQLTPTWRGLAVWLEEPLTEIRRLLEKRLALLDLLLREDWDCCLFVLHEIDLLQHLYWDRVLDLRREVIACYRLLDELLGQALSVLRSADLLILLSPYSFQSIRRTFYLQEYLRRYTLNLPVQDTLVRQRVDWPARRWKLGLLSHLPAQRRWRIWRRAAFPTGGGAPPLAGSSLLLLPTSSPLGGYAAIALADHLTEKQIEEFMADLQAQVDPATAYPAIGDLYRDETYPGSHVPAAEPEPTLPGKPTRRLILLAHDGIMLSLATGQRRLWSAGEPCCGMHHPDGLLCLYGAGLQRSVLRPVSAYDIVPTILEALNIPVPAQLVGRPLIGAGAPLASPFSI